MPHIETHFLRDTDHGGLPAQPKDVAALLADFAAAATSSLHLAVYDFRLDEPLTGIVVRALTQAAERGVDVRIAYDHGGKTTALAAGPVGEPALAFAAAGADPAPVGTHAWLHQHFDGTGVRLGPIDPGHQIMHHKYVIRDGGASSGTVWTGSTNFTTDAWTHQENNIVLVASPAVAAGYDRDFADLWTTGKLAGTGLHDQGSTIVDGWRADWDFAPGDGPAIDAALARMVTAARSRIDLASMMLTSGTVLGALSDALDRGVPVSGIYDAGQMGPVVHTWKGSATGAAKAALFEKVAHHLVGKRSEPYTPTSKHNFMHHKVLVCDGDVATGSFNFSSNATRNAENIVMSAAGDVADRYRSMVGELVAVYG